MKTMFLMWLTIAGGFWTWHVMAANDVVFSRALHDEAFAVYGTILGLDPALLPPMIVRALLFDGAILLAIIAFRQRRMLVGFVSSRFSAFRN